MESRRHNGIAATENTAKAMNCACQFQSTNIEMAPTSIAARPSHSMNTPGDNTSRTSNNPPAMNQPQNPSEVNSVDMEQLSSSDSCPDAADWRPAAGGSVAAARSRRDGPGFHRNVLWGFSRCPGTEQGA